MSSPQAWTPLELVRWTAGYFDRHDVPTPRLDAELLLAHVLGIRRIDLYLRFETSVEAPERERYREMVRRRAEERVPIAYLTGEREFWSRPFRVTPEVLTPRPETESVVEAVVALGPSRVVDAGTGSGIIACAVALELPETRVLALDRSVGAVRVARENVQRFGLGERVGLVVCNWLSAVREQADVVVANPPYVCTEDLDRLQPEVRHEPRAALDGGSDGLEAIRELVCQAPLHLRRPGAIVLEVGAGQASRVEGLLRAAGADQTEVRKDLSGMERVVIGRFGEG